MEGLQSSAELSNNLGEIASVQPCAAKLGLGPNPFANDRQHVGRLSSRAIAFAICRPLPPKYCSSLPDGPWRRQLAKTVHVAGGQMDRESLARVIGRARQLSSPDRRSSSTLHPVPRRGDLPSLRHAAPDRKRRLQAPRLPRSSRSRPISSRNLRYVLFAGAQDGTPCARQRTVRPMPAPQNR